MRVKTLAISNFCGKRDYKIDFGNCPCLTGDNGSGKTGILAVTHGLLEYMATGIPTKLMSLLRKETEHPWYGRTVTWAHVFDKAAIETSDGKKLAVTAIDAREGKYAVIQDGERSELSDVLTGDFPDTIPFLREDRNSNPGITFGTLLAMNSQEFDEERARRLCNVLMGLDAPLRFFEPLPSKFDFRGQGAWFTRLDRWLEPQSHGEREVMNLSVATAYAKKTHRPVFIDGLDAGIHPLSQERLADAIGEFEADGVQIIYTTRSPFCFLRDRTFDLDTGKPVKHYIGDKA